jgi:hypothetical protein
MYAESELRLLETHALPEATPTRHANVASSIHFYKGQGRMPRTRQRHAGEVERFAGESKDLLRK